jgi:hypothetical protein
MEDVIMIRNRSLLLLSLFVFTNVVPHKVHAGEPKPFSMPSLTTMVQITAGIVMGAFLLKKLFSSPEKSAPKKKSFFDTPITFSTSIREITIQQIKVERQKGATCGMHALKNALNMIDSLKKGVNPSLSINDNTITTIEQLQELSKEYQKMIVNDKQSEEYQRLANRALRDNQNKNRSNIKNRAINLYNKMHGREETAESLSYEQECELTGWWADGSNVTKAHLDYLIDQFDMRPYITVIQTRADNPDKLELGDLKDVERSPATGKLASWGRHAYIIMVPGHWITVVIDRNLDPNRNPIEKTTYYVADSLNENRRRCPQIEHLLELIESDDIQSAYKKVMYPQPQKKKSVWEKIKQWFSNKR